MDNAVLMNFLGLIQLTDHSVVSVIHGYEALCLKPVESDLDLFGAAFQEHADNLLLDRCAELIAINKRLARYLLRTPDNFKIAGAGFSCPNQIG